MQPLGADAVDRRDRAVEDVVEALELGGPLEGQDVERLLDDAQPALVPAAVAADRAQLLVADVEAALAEHDLVADVDEGRGERPGLGVGRAEQVVGQPLGGLRADPGQARERFDEPRDGLDEGGRHAPVTSPGCLRPPVTAAIFCSASSRDARRASLTAATTRSWSISTSAGSTADGSIVMLTSSCLPVTVALTTPPPAEPSTCAASSSPWTRSHLLLHLLRHPLQVGHPHRVLLLVVVAASLTDASTACRGRVGRQSISPTSTRSSPKMRRASAMRNVVRARCRGRDLDVRDDAADPDVAADDLADAGLDAGLLPLGDLAQEGLLLGEAEGHDDAVEGDRPARQDERLDDRLAAEQP